MTFLCDTEHVNDYSDAAQVVYLILFIEYSFMLTLLVYFMKKSFKDPLLNLTVYKDYLLLVGLSALIKLLMFSGTCFDYNDWNSVFIMSYGIPYYSGETIIIYIW